MKRLVIDLDCDDDAALRKMVNNKFASKVAEFAAHSLGASDDHKIEVRLAEQHNHDSSDYACEICVNYARH